MGAWVVHAEPNRRVFEIRTYTAAEGKLDALQARFRHHTVALFTKHDMSAEVWTQAAAFAFSTGDLARP